ncbi:MAG TPA: sugar porter family MFS transporter, partial [Bacteroidales bacterium]|nr:sugar porter family MFS transporter [Bacteroidales bacterium]
MKTFSKLYIYKITIVSAMGGFLFGYDWVVIGGAKPFYEVFFQISGSAQLQAWAMSSAILGCVLGAVFSGFLSDNYGRRKPLLLSAALFFIASIGTGLAETLWVFIGFRILGGVGIGLASAISTVYIAEIAPAAFRGRFVALNQLTIVIGILSAQIVNYLIAEKVPLGADEAFILGSWNGQMGWRWMFFVCAFPSLVFLLMLMLMPESPRWLLKAGKTEKAMRILQRVGGSDYANSESATIQNALNQASEITSLRKLIALGMGNVLVLGVVIAVFQQWSGINTVFNYAQEVFAAAGYGISDTLFNIVFTGSVNLVFTLIAMNKIDKWGRKSLMLAGASGLAVIYLFLGGAFYFDLKGMVVLLLVVAAIAIYAMTLAPVTWVVLSEIFPTKVRGAAMALSTFALWTACFILTYTFPLINEALGTSGTFWVYGLICAAGFW